MLIVKHLENQTNIKVEKHHSGWHQRVAWGALLQPPLAPPKSLQIHMQLKGNLCLPSRAACSLRRKSLAPLWMASKASIIESCRAQCPQCHQTWKWLLSAIFVPVCYLFLNLFFIEIQLTDNYIGFRRRQWHPTPVLLLRKSHGWRSLLGCNPWGR